MESGRIEALLANLQEQGRSSPAGMHWLKFFELLLKHGKPNVATPPVPMILAASAESDASKHRRLGEQLRWAETHGCLDAALRHLSALPEEHWNTCSPARWHQDSYPSW